MTTSREQFDQYLKSQQLKPVGWIRDEYWKIWQASRAALVVELPQREPDNGTDAQVDISAGFANRMLDKCAKILRAAGITVKGDSDEANANAS